MGDRVVERPLKKLGDPNLITEINNNFHYITKFYEWQKIKFQFIKEVNDHKIITFDVETNIYDRSFHKKIYLIHITTYFGTVYAFSTHLLPRLPKIITEILSNAEFIKIGSGIQRDVNNYQRQFKPSKIHGWIDCNWLCVDMQKMKRLPNGCYGLGKIAFWLSGEDFRPMSRRDYIAKYKSIPSYWRDSERNVRNIYNFTGIDLNREQKNYIYLKGMTKILFYRKCFPQIQCKLIEWIEKHPY